MDPLTMFSCPFRHDTTLQHLPSAKRYDNRYGAKR
jgi:hypothetical protein